MSAADRLRWLVGTVRPQVSTAFLTYIDIATKLTQMEEEDAARREERVERYRFHEITSAADPELDFAPAWQREMCKTEMATGAWYCLVAYDGETGEKVGHVWATTESTRGLRNGIMDVTLAPDEAYVWDLFIDPAHRRMVLSQEIGHALIRTFHSRGKRWGLTHVLFDNAASVLWHHMFGFNVAQLFNFVKIGDRILWKVPLGESPRYGPLSSDGRHAQPDPPDPFGLSFVPAADPQLDRSQIRGMRRRGHEHD
jgi:GNAT superfamily N-acetyltransferase